SAPSERSAVDAPTTAPPRAEEAEPDIEPDSVLAVPAAAPTAPVTTEGATEPPPTDAPDEPEEPEEPVIVEVATELDVAGPETDAPAVADVAPPEHHEAMEVEADDALTGAAEDDEDRAAANAER
ncbi:MAG: hypothetical protein H0V33_03825, partial [Acidimicrobiia bacterium]|nr:hypothetical protein [Acidimicrobiia bacterium]